MKQCTSCGGLFEATEEYFGKCSRASDGLRPECRNCKKDNDTAYRNSIPGYLRRAFSNITRRCSGQSDDPRHAYCFKQGITMGFESADEFVYYVMYILQIDPRGKHCHRILTSGNYEPGNIEFVTREVHDKIHAGMRAV